MQFALFYEIPVPRPWTPRAEYEAFQNTLTIELMGKHVIPHFDKP